MIKVGRWLTPDPLGYADGLNRYLYVGNDPLNMVDPWGLSQERVSLRQWWDDNAYGLMRDLDDMATVLSMTPIGFVGGSVVKGTRSVSSLGREIVSKMTRKMNPHIIAAMKKRGWTIQQIYEAITRGKAYPAIDKSRMGQAATRYVHPEPGKSVVVNNITGDIIHVGEAGFRY